MWRSHERESVEFRCTMDVDEAVVVDTHLGKLPSLKVPGHLASRCPVREPLPRSDEWN